MIRGVLGSRASIGGVLGSGRGGAGNGLLTGLVAYWALDEAGGANNALDKHSGGLTLTQSSSPGADTGKVYATARTFNGSQYFNRSSESATQIGNIDFALAAWVYNSGSTSAALTVIAKWSYTTNSREYLVAHASSQVTFFVSPNGTGNTPVSVAVPTASAWHLYMAWHDATADKIYLQIDNGTPAEQAHSTGVYAGNSLFEIGQLIGLNRWIGRIGPVAMWKNRTLSASDRTALYNGGAGLAYSAFTA